VIKSARRKHPNAPVTTLALVSPRLGLGKNK
jgi:hypothetical protein